MAGAISGAHVGHGVDQFMLLIDRVPDDNVKQVSITNAATTAAR
jgi:hypothetical protein